MMRKFLMVLCIKASMLATAAVHAQTTYRVSSPSRIQISGTSTLSDWVVKSEEVSGEMTFVASGKKEDGKAFKSGVIRDGKAMLEVSTIKSEKGETMDNKIHNALKNDAFPQITFVLTAPVSVSNTEGKASATGNVEIAGVTRTMTFNLDVGYVDNVFHLQGSRSLKLTEFDVEPPTAMFGQIVTGDEVAVALDLYFSPAK